jgi:hypothetical protein
MLPLSQEQLLGVFERYNLAVRPLQVVPGLYLAVQVVCRLKALL